MPEERDIGVIVRLHAYSDTSWIVHWFTAEHGRLATLAKGARRAKSPFHGRLDLFHAGALSFLPSRRSALHTLLEFSPDARHAGVRSDYQKLVQAAYAVALMERGTETDTPIPELHGLFREWLAQMDRQEVRPRMVLAFEARFLQRLGLDPAAANTPLTPASRELLTRLMELPWEEMRTLAPAAATVRQVGEFLRRQLGEAMGAVPPNRREALLGTPPST